MSEQNNIIKFRKSAFMEHAVMNLDEVEMVCVPSKPKYGEVDLCLQRSCNHMNLVIGTVNEEWLSFEDRIKIGKEIAKRWNNFNKELKENV